MSIISSNERAAYVASLRAFADFLESNTGVKIPGDQRLLLPLHTNPAVLEFAAAHGLTVEYDDYGNALADLIFGPITYHVYGYVDFAEHCKQVNERRARKWVADQGLEIREPAGGAA